MSAIDPGSPPPRRTTTIAVLLVSIAFAAGLLIGVAGDRVYLIHGHQLLPGRAFEFASRHLVDRMDHELDLTPQQREQVQGIVDRHHARIKAIWSAVRPQARVEIDQANQEIARILTPDQRVRYEKLRMEMAHRQPPGPRP